MAAELRNAPLMNGRGSHKQLLPNSSTLPGRGKDGLPGTLGEKTHRSYLCRFQFRVGFVTFRSEGVGSVCLVKEIWEEERMKVDMSSWKGA